VTGFDGSRWARADFSREYREKADIYIVERWRMFGIMKSFYRHFLGDGRHRRVLDLGCGDGVATHGILSVGEPVSATLIDASDDMLDKARERLGGFSNIDYVRATFQEMIEREVLEGDFDFIVSSLAIHHLTMNEKRALFRLTHAHLKAGGYFMNIDVVLPPAVALDQWYMKLWAEWMDERKAALGMEGGASGEVIQRYRDGEDNKPDTPISLMP